jgi:hypothetical protein
VEIPKTEQEARAMAPKVFAADLNDPAVPLGVRTFLKIAQQVIAKRWPDAVPKREGEETR